MPATCSQLLADATRRASQHLTDEGRTRITDFLVARQQADGGFRGRSHTSDLYYTFFAIRALSALDAPLPANRTADYLRAFHHGEALDFVHLACLACLAADVLSREPDLALLDRLETFRASDGGYSGKPGGVQSAADSIFLAMMAYEAQGVPIPNREALARSVEWLAPSVTTAVAARVILLTSLGIAPPASVGEGLLARASRRGGFRALSLAPIPDLLSTATSLCALHALGQSVAKIREATTDFVVSLWDDNGGFRGHRLDSTPDCEYTFYALLALGVLAQEDPA